MPKVLFLPYKIEINVSERYNLMRAAIDAGVHVNASCGGEGICGKCRVNILEGYVQGGISKKINDKDIKNNLRLACKSTIIDDLIVSIPVESRDDLEKINLHSGSEIKRTLKISQVNFETLKKKGVFKPPIEKYFLQLPKPNSSDRLSDVLRILEYLKSYFHKRKLQVDLPVIRKIPNLIRESDFSITVVLAKPIKKTNKTKIIDIQLGNTTNHNFAIAMDIGTTTVYGQIINLLTGNVLAEYGCINGQVSYGEDVISRIIFTEKHKDLKEINDVIIKTINNVIDKIINISGVNFVNISTITFAGNTTMTQLLLKINPHHIRIAPYIPASTFYPPIPVKDLGIALQDHAIALVYPTISSYVGGDIVAGVIGSGMYMREDLTLFMDLGTNAEIVIGNKDWLLCAACSAGPAFEGGGIEFGIRASAGAIEDCFIDFDTLEPKLITIENVLPKGICGSGLITIVAVLFEIGIINNVGKFNRDLATSRIRKRDEIYEYVLAWAKETQIDRDISITEVDINNLIRAKGAIFSGCMSLLNEIGMNVENIEHILIAGGFGSSLDLDKAMTIGLLPEIDPGKVTFIGNSSLLGARMSSLSNNIRQDVADVVNRMTNCELSEVSSYMDNYVASLFLPHTNIDLFPLVKEKLLYIRDRKNKERPLN